MLPVETPSQRAERLARERRLSSPETEEQRAERLAMLDRPEDDRAGRIARNLGIPQVEADIIAGSSFATGPRVEAPEEPFYQAQENFGLPTRPEDIDKAPWARTKSAAYADVFDQLAKQPGFLPKQTPGEQDALLYGAMRNIAIDQAIRANPDEEARIRDLARKLQLPSAMVRAIGQAEANNRIVKQQAQQALGTAPSLAKAFMQPDFAKLAADDLQSLSGIERTLRELFGGGEQSANSAALAELEYKMMESKALRPSEIMEYQRLKARNAVLQQQQEMTENGVTWTTNALASGVTDFALGIPEAATYGLAGSLFGMPGAGFALGQVTYNFRQIAANSFGEYKNFRDDLGRLIDQDVARGAAYINASLSVGLEVIGERAQLRAVPGFDKLVGGKDAIKKLLQTEAGRNVMMRVGKKIATGAIVEGVTEGLQELSQIAFGEAAKTVAPGEFAPVTAQDVFARVGEAAAAGALVGGAIVGTTAPIQVAIENRELRKADIALSTSQGSIDRIETVLNIASESKLIARDRGELEKFIDDAAADGPVSTVYFSADDLANVAREAGLEPQQLAQQLGVTDQIQPASVTNALLEMPVGKFIATVADTDLAKPLIQVIKTNPFLLNRAEQEAYSSGGRQDIIAEADRLVQQALTDETFAAEAQSIQDEVLQQFRVFEGGEVFTPEVNRAYATITTQGYVSLARRMGISPREAYQKYQTGPLQIQRQAATEEGMGQPVLAQAKQVGYEGQNIGEAQEWVRAREKGLDMSQEGRLQRAREMGFEGGYFKGMYPYDWTKEVGDYPGPPITEIKRTSPFPSFGGTDGDVEGIAGFLTKDPNVANRFASAFERGAVYPLVYRRGKTFEIDAEGKAAAEIQFGENGRAFRDIVRSGEYDTIIIRNTKDEGDVVVALNPSNIRSVNAAFDPEFAESANILAQEQTLGQERELDAMGFVSLALEAAKALPDRRMTFDEAAGRIAKGRGLEGYRGNIKDEIEALGLRDAFGDREKVTREDIVQFIENARIVLQEVTASTQNAQKPTKEAFLNSRTAKDHMSMNGRSMYFGEIEVTSSAKPDYVSMGDGFKAIDMEGDEFKVTRVLAQKKRATGKWTLYHDTEFTEAIRELDIDPERARTIEQVKEAVLDEFRSVNFDRLKRKLKTDDAGYSEYVEEVSMGGLRVGTSYDVDQDPKIVRGETSLVFDGEQVKDLPPGQHTDIDNELLHIFWAVRKDENGQDTLFTRQLQSDLVQQTRRKKEEAQKRIKSLRVYQRENEYYVRSIEGETGPYATEAEAKQALESAKTDTSKDIRFPLARTQQWTGAGVRAMLIRAARDGYSSISFPTGNTSALIQGNRSASGHYNTNVKGALERVAQIYGGKVREGFVRTDAEGFRIINKKGASLGTWPTLARAEKIIRETIDYYKENEILSDDWNAIKTGTRFEDFSIEDASVASTYVLDITPEMRARILGEGVPLFAPGRRAQYQPDLNRIMLLPKADWSSYLHEMGHHFLEVYNNAALQIMQTPEADRTPDEQKLVDDMSLLLTDMARQAGTPITGDVLQWWANTPLDDRRPVHEKYAQATEKYFMEGKAPVPELQSLFDKFRDWLIETYKRLATVPNVELSDEVRGVMDRMYAAHETVRTAEYNRKLVALFREKPEDMTEQEWTAYQQLAAQATDDAQSDLTARSLRDMQWLSGARARVLRRLQRENADKRKVVAAEVTAEVMAQPVNVARSFLRRGIAPNGEPVVGPHKLSIDLMKARYPETDVDGKLVRSIVFARLGYGQYGMLAKDGMDPDMAAELLGYPSGDALINDLLSAQPEDYVIKTETDRRMLERFGDLNDETKLSRAADEVIHSAMRAKVLQAEYAALSKAAKQTRPVALAAKEIAKEIVGRQVASKLNLNRYLAAERAAGRKAEAAMRSGDFRAAASAKRDQLLNFEVVREMQRVLKERNRALDLFDRINKAKRDTVAKTRNYDLVQAARAILAAYGFGSVKNQPIDYMAAVKAYDPALYSALEPTIADAIATKKTIDQLTVSEFLGMRDVVRKFWDLSREEMKVDIEGRQLDLADVVQELTVQLEAQGVTPKGPSTQTPSEWQKRLRQFAGLKAGLRRVESWARLYDGGKVAAFTKYIWRPVSEAADRYRADRNKYILKYRELFRVIEPTMGGGKIIAPEINFTFRNKSELLHAIMHTGNSSNYRKLLLGRGWGTEDQDGNLIDNAWQNLISRLANQGILTKADFDFAQSVWDLLEETKPLAQAAHKKVFGSYFSEITAEEVQTPFGTYKGGYIPAVYDTYNVQDAALRAQQDAVEANDSTMFPSPASGFTKSRVDYNKELALDLMILPQHIDKVLKFAHLASPVRDVLKILKNRSFSAVLESADPTAQSDILLPWLTRAARQIIEEPTKGQGGPMVDGFFRIIRQRAGMGLMFANLVNVAQQVTGFSVAALQVKPRYLASGLIRYTRNPMAITKAIRQASPMMADRGDNQLAAMYGTIDKIIDKDNKYAQVQDWFGRHTYFMQQGVQNVMDVIVWLGAYDQALAQGATDQEAAKQGDAAVRQTQGSTLPEDVSRIETGTPMLRSFVHMYGYFNMWGNVLSTEVRTLMRDMGLKKGAGRLMFVYIAGFAIPAVAAQLIADGMRGQLPEDEDDDGWLEEWLAWYFGTQAKTVTAFAPIVGQAINAIPGAWTSVPYDDRIAGSPAISVVEGGLRTISGKTVYDAIAEDGDKSKAIKDVLSLITLVTGVPVQALSRPIGYAVDVAEGDIEPTSELDYIRGLVTGTASEASRQ